MDNTSEGLRVTTGIETASDLDNASPAKATTPLRSRLGTLARVLVSVALLVFVFHKTSWSDITSMVSQTNPWFLILSILVGLFISLLSSWKWGLLLRPFGVEVPVPRLFFLYLVGGFFSNILPTNVGGDLVRVAAVARATPKRAAAVTSVFMERFTGVTILIVLSLISLVANPDLRDIRVVGATGIVTAAYVVALVLMLTPRYLFWIERRRLPNIARKALGKVHGFQAAIHQYRHHPWVLIETLAISVLWYIGATLNVYTSALAFGQSVSFSLLIISVPLILTITMLPISLGGIGLGEWAYSFVFTQIGAGAPIGLLVALLLRAKSIGVGAVGAGLYGLGFGDLRGVTIDRTVAPAEAVAEG